MNDEPDKQIVGFVKITNGLPVPLEDRHDGIPYTIAPGGTLAVPAIAAAHMFGWWDLGARENVSTEVEMRRKAMQRHTCKRQGWNTAAFSIPDEKTQKTRAELYFDKLKIEVVRYKMVPVEEDDSRPIPADPAPETARTIPRRVEVRA